MWVSEIGGLPLSLSGEWLQSKLLFVSVFPSSLLSGSYTMFFKLLSGILRLFCSPRFDSVLTQCVPSLASWSLRATVAERGGHRQVGRGLQDKEGQSKRDKPG